MFLEVTKAKYLKDYEIMLWFNNGEKRRVNLKESLVGPVFEQLNYIEYFKNFTIKFNTIEWNNGADFAPEYLYEISKPTK